ncbi:MAG: zinc-finger domain-containing protein [Gammaproteobacteria bacterium]|nr:zinc-finger domain-containing protein [Gammaproteobacteria bacterium]
MACNKKQACTAVHYEVTQNDLPLSCPMPSMRLWDAHPRVFLPIAETGHAVCPYCSTEYFLKDYEKRRKMVEA